MDNAEQVAQPKSSTQKQCLAKGAKGSKGARTNVSQTHRMSEEKAENKAPIIPVEKIEEGTGSPVKLHTKCDQTTTLQTVDLRRHNISDTSIDLINASIHKLTSNEDVCLDLSNNYISDRGIEKICDLLSRSDKCITHLYISHNQFGDTGAKTLARFISSNARVRVLDVARNYITVNGALSLIHAVKINTALERLLIRGNAIYCNLELFIACFDINTALSYRYK